MYFGCKHIDLHTFNRICCLFTISLFQSLSSFNILLFLLLISLYSSSCQFVVSCIFLPGTVGVGSSGAVLGMLASWVVWIIFRWYGCLVCECIVCMHSVIIIYMRYGAYLYLSFSHPPLVSLCISLFFPNRKKIPHACKSQRNCQLFIVVASVVVTLATSFQPNVDWAAHIGGAIQVILLRF